MGWLRQAKSLHTRASGTECDVHILLSLSFDRQSSPTPALKAPESAPPPSVSPHHLSTCYQRFFFITLKQGTTHVTYERHHYRLPASGTHVFSNTT